MLLLAWWDTAFAIWMYWVGLARFLMVVAGWRQGWCVFGARAC